MGMCHCLIKVGVKSSWKCGWIWRLGVRIKICQRKRWETAGLWPLQVRKDQKAMHRGRRCFIVLKRHKERRLGFWWQEVWGFEQKAASFGWLFCICIPPPPPPPPRPVIKMASRKHHYDYLEILVWGGEGEESFYVLTLSCFPSEESTGVE